jgi:subfamily B ATP-binding cassette protein MsbA
MKTYLRLLSYARPIGKFVVPYAIFSFLSIVFGLLNFTLIIPLLNVLFEVGPVQEPVANPVIPSFDFSFNYFIDLFNYYFYTALEAHGKEGTLWYVCAVIITSVLLANVFKYLAVRVEEYLRSHTVKKLRQDIFEKMVSLHMGYFSNERKGDLMSRITTDVQEVEGSVANTMTVVFREPVTIIGFFVILMKMSVELTLFTLVVIPISGLIISTLVKKLKRAAHAGQESLSSLITIIDESLSGMRIINAFNALGYIKNKFKKENYSYADIIRGMAAKRELASPLSEFMGVFVVSFILLYGGRLVLSNQSELSAPEFITYIILFSQVMRPAKAMSTAFSNIQRGLAAGDRILQIVDTKPQITSKPGAKVLEKFNDSIEFRNVSFAYETSPVLRNINLVIPKGKSIALVGQSGGGKSTIADLIPRFYDPQAGAVLIDGTDLRSYDLESIRSHIGIVTQESILFNDSIFSNIAFGKEDATMEEVVKAAKIANAHDFIMQTENGYDTIIGDRGMKLSGGQRQRLSIARAVFKNPPILILDEATSALDTESEKLVQEALFNLMKNRTSLIIAHRLSTIQHCDEIVVVQKGEIEERGTHEELLENEQGLYRKLNALQTL